MSQRQRQRMKTKLCAMIIAKALHQLLFTCFDVTMHNNHAGATHIAALLLS